MSITKNLQNIISSIPPTVTLVAVTKNHSVENLQELYSSGHRQFGENKVQEMMDKYNALPKDIEWHLIGHLQTNKVKFIAPFVTLIHSVDSLKLLQEINKQAQTSNRIIRCLLQVYIANEETKFGFSLNEVVELIESGELEKLDNISIKGLMGMATNTDNESQINEEFAGLSRSFNILKNKPVSKNVTFDILSMGMSADYKMAIKNGSTMIRVGSLIFA